MESSPEAFYYAAKGYFDKETAQSALVRLQTAYIVQVMGNGKQRVQPTDLWKLPGDELIDREKRKAIVVDREQWRKMKEIHKMKRKTS